MVKKTSNTLINTLMNIATPPNLDLGPRTEIVDIKTIINQLEPTQKLMPPLRYQAFYALVLLWNDSWNESHQIVQAHEGNPDCDLVHGLAHRKEGSFSNAKWWARQLGNHPSFEIIGKELNELMLPDKELTSILLPAGKYDLLHWVSVFARSPKRNGLVQAQAMEWRALASSWLNY